MYEMPYKNKYIHIVSYGAACVPPHLAYFKEFFGMTHLSFHTYSF